MIAKLADKLIKGDLHKHFYSKAYSEYKNASLDEAIKYSLFVLDIVPGNENAMLLIIHCYAKINKLEEAYQLLKRKQESLNNVDNIWFALGGLYDEKNMHNMAIICYEKAININPNSMDSLINLGIIYYYNILFDILVRVINMTIILTIYKCMN